MILYEARYSRAGQLRQLHFTARGDEAALRWAHWWTGRFQGELLGLQRCRGRGTRRKERHA